MIASVRHDANWLTVSWNDGSADTYPAMWLYDNVAPGRPRGVHGRSAYTNGDRHLLRCYADKDALHSMLRVLEAK